MYLNYVWIYRLPNIIFLISTISKHHKFIFKWNCILLLRRIALLTFYKFHVRLWWHKSLRFILKYTVRFKLLFPRKLFLKRMLTSLPNLSTIYLDLSLYKLLYLTLVVRLYSTSKTPKTVIRHMRSGIKPTNRCKNVNEVSTNLNILHNVQCANWTHSLHSTHVPGGNYCQHFTGF